MKTREKTRLSLLRNLLGCNPGELKVGEEVTIVGTNPNAGIWAKVEGNERGSVVLVRTVDGRSLAVLSHQLKKGLL